MLRTHGSRKAGEGSRIPESKTIMTQDRFEKLVTRIANWTEAEIGFVDVRQTRDIAKKVVEGADPNYPPFPGGVPELEDSPPTPGTQTTGAEAQACPKSADDGALDGGAAMLGAIHDCAAVDSEATTRENIAVGGDLEVAGYLRSSDAPDAPVGPEIDPTRQRTMFEQLIAEGRPSTVEVKAALDELGHAAQFMARHPQLEGDNDAKVYGPDYANFLNRIAAMLDRQGCALIAQDIELLEANKALDIVAAGAVRPSDEEVAALVDRARRWIENSAGDKAPAIVLALRTPTRLISELILAVLAQARAAQPASEGVDLSALVDGASKAIARLGRVGMWHASPGAGHGDSFVGGDLADIIRDMLNTMSDMEVDRDAARDCVKDVEQERDEARRDFERQRENYASTAASLAWVQTAFAAKQLPEEINAVAWGMPAGEVAEKWVAYLRDQVAELFRLNERAHRNLGHVQRNTAEYREESRRRKEAADERARGAEAWSARRAEVINQLMRPSADVETILRIKPEHRTGSQAAEVALWQHECTGNALRFIAELATMTDTEADALDGSEIREVARMLQVPDDDGERAPTVPRLYGDEDRKRAIADLLRLPAMRSGDTERDSAGLCFDTVAEALGMRRA